jgi:mRNA interferase MazF
LVKIGDRIPERGDIIKLQLNPQVGSEQAGFRPAIVISPKPYNRISNLILICSITTKKKGWGFEVVLPSDMKTFGIVLADQLRIVDCNKSAAIFVEPSPTQLIDEVLAKIKTLTS